MVGGYISDGALWVLRGGSGDVGCKYPWVYAPHFIWAPNGQPLIERFGPNMFVLVIVLQPTSHHPRLRPPLYPYTTPPGAMYLRGSSGSRHTARWSGTPMHAPRVQLLTHPAFVSPFRILGHPSALWFLHCRHARHPLPLTISLLLSGEPLNGEPSTRPPIHPLEPCSIGIFMSVPSSNLWA